MTFYNRNSNATVRSFESFYSQSNRLLGKGGFGSVYLGTRLTDNLEVAVKVISNSNLSPTLVHSIETEVTVLQVLNHPNVIKFFDLFEDRRSFKICMELVRGCDLFERIAKKSSYTEKDAQSVCRIILGALKHCHDLNVIHRDLKPENLMLRDNHNDNDIIIVDFGLSIIAPAPTVTGLVGTHEYMAPEILRNESYGKAVDMWSFGVIAYILLGGYQPFTADGDPKLLVRRIRAAAYAFHDEYWRNMSAQSKDFISKLLTKDPKDRMTVNIALQHEWLNLQELEAYDLADSLKKLHRFNARKKIRAVFKTVLLMNRWKKLFRGSDDADKQAASVGVDTQVSPLNGDEATEDVLATPVRELSQFTRSFSVLRDLEDQGVSTGSILGVPRKASMMRSFSTAVDNASHTNPAPELLSRLSTLALARSDSVAMSQETESQHSIPNQTALLVSRLSTLARSSSTITSDAASASDASSNKPPPLQRTSSSVMPPPVPPTATSFSTRMSRAMSFKPDPLVDNLLVLNKTLQAQISRAESALSQSLLDDCADADRIQSLTAQIEMLKKTLQSAKETISAIQN